MNIFEALREEHEIQRNLVDALIKTSGDTPERETLFNQLKTELQIHEDAEERFFYIPLIEDDMTQDQARHSISEHHEIDELIEKMEKTEFSSTAWLTFAKQLKEQVTHHLDEEEHKVFQMAGKVLTENQKNMLAKEYREDIEENRPKEYK